MGLALGQVDVAERGVEGGRLGARAGRGQLEPVAAPAAGARLGGADERLADAAAPVGGGDDESDQAREAVPAGEVRRGVDGHDAGHVAVELGDQERGARRRLPRRDALLDRRRGQRVAPVLEQRHERRRVLRARRTDRHGFSGRAPSHR
jgi:hypothetical protein